MNPNQQPFHSFVGMITPTKRKFTDNNNYITLDSYRYDVLNDAFGHRSRKGRMRNKACPCESGKKFKNCCYEKFGVRSK